MLAHSPKELALFVVNQRKKQKLSQAEVGKRVGLKQQTVSEFELKPEGTQLSTLFSILSAVNLDIKIFTKEKTVFPGTLWKDEW